MHHEPVEILTARAILPFIEPCLDTSRSHSHTQKHAHKRTQYLSDDVEQVMEGKVGDTLWVELISRGIEFINVNLIPPCARERSGAERSERASVRSEQSGASE